MRELTFEQITEGQVPDTSEECFALAAAALVQAERMVGEREPRLDVAHACTAIAFGWTALGRGLQGEPERLLGPPMDFGLQDMSEYQVPATTPTFDAVSGELDPPVAGHLHSPACEPNCDQVPIPLLPPSDHVHSSACNHHWHGTLCMCCSDDVTSYAQRCSHFCPDPGKRLVR